MAKNTIKGLTVEIGGDTTKLGKALENVNKKSRDLSSELGQVNRLLKLDPGNADLLAQKQKILADAVENTKEKLGKLKEAEKQVQQQFEKGEVTEAQFRELQREITATEQKLGQYEDAAREAARAVEGLGDKAEKSAKANDTMFNGLKNGVKVLGSLVTAAVAALVSAAEATREYRTEMAKLDTAFTTNGHTSEAATGAYKELVGILGETDQSVEAANHLAVLTKNEKDLATWTGDILPGVFATFGASLPIEGLTEAANETAKVGQVTGPLADALNWAGISEEKFNEKLEKCSNEQERQTLIMNTLKDAYGDASAQYKETNADVIAANQANEAWMASMAEVGAVIEPVLTTVKEMGAALLSQLVPVIEWVLNNVPTISVVVGGVTAAMVAFKIASLAAAAALEGTTLAAKVCAAAQAALNTVLNANPIGLVILALTALVAAFVYLWKHSESFREFWIDLWAKIKSAVSKTVEWFKKVPDKIKSAISGALDKVQAWGNNLVSKAKQAATNFVNAVVTFFKQLPGKVWTWLVNVVSKVGNWASNLAAKGKAAAKSLLDAVVNGIKSLPQKVLSVGKDLVSGLWNGISNKLSWLKQKIKGFTSSVLGSIKDFFGVHSPAESRGGLKTTDWIGEMLDEGLAVGLEDNVKSPIKAMQRVSRGVLDAAATDLNGLHLTRSVAARPAAAAASVAADYSGLAAKLDGIYERLGRLQIVLDTGALVGEAIDKIDAGLATRQLLSARGV